MIKIQPSTYEYFVVENINGRPLETDRFEYNRSGEILKWEVYSHLLTDYCELPISQYNKSFESKFDKIQKDIFKKCAEMDEEEAS